VSFTASLYAIFLSKVDSLAGMGQLRKFQNLVYFYLRFLLQWEVTREKKYIQ
jgi:hypothetical protein